MALTVPVLSKVPNLLKELVKAVPNVNFHYVDDPGKPAYLQATNNAEFNYCLRERFIF
jgi:hypothetical protein